MHARFQRGFPCHVNHNSKCCGVNCVCCYCTTECFYALSELPPECCACSTASNCEQWHSAVAEGLAPVDLLLLMAAQENDTPRVAELIRAGADLNTKVCSPAPSVAANTLAE